MIVDLAASVTAYAMGVVIFSGGAVSVELSRQRRPHNAGAGAHAGKATGSVTTGKIKFCLQSRMYLIKT